MAAARQPHVLNSFIHAVRSCKPNTYRSIRSPPSSRSKLHTATPLCQTAYPNRYGPAATDTLPPPPKPAGALTAGKEKATSVETQQAQQKRPTQQDTVQQQASSSKLKEEQEERRESNASRSTKEVQSVEQNNDQSPLEQAAAAQAQASKSQNQDELPPELDPSKPLKNEELDIVLSVPAPSELTNGKSRHPHLEPSPYEHHFDTYSLVQELAKDPDTYTEKQSITVMKAIRLMLSLNLELAKEGLISKSDIENESYLFRAACSELKTTLQTTRATENQRQRTQRAALQHEFDILYQKITQDIQTMREELKAMFNDRKMTLQEEKRKTDSQISELNYEITVLLNSEAKSEVEGLRWVLTRRAAMAIAVAAFMTLSALQFYSVKSREMAEIEKKRAAAAKAQEERMAKESMPNRNNSTQTDMRAYEENLG